MQFEMLDSLPLQNNGKPNQLSEKITPYSLVINESNGDSKVTIPANSTSTVTLSTDRSGMLDIRRFGSISTANFLVRLFDNQPQKYLSNRSLHNKTIFGNVNSPFILPLPLRIRESESISAEITDLSGASNEIRLSLSGYKYYFDADRDVFNKNPINRIARPYFYTTDTSIELPASSTATNAYIQMMSDSDFYWLNTYVYSENNFLIKVSNTSTGFQYMNSWLHSSLWAGTTKENSKNRTKPILIKKTSRLKLEMQNLVPATTNKVYVTFVGYTVNTEQ